MHQLTARTKQDLPNRFARPQRAVPCHRQSRYACLIGLLWLALSSPPSHAACNEHSLALQVLGSGGPIADDTRAGSGFLLWHQQKAIMLIDAGGGVFQRFGAAGGNLRDLELIALTHFHTDHVADLPALLKGAYFSDRERSLPISGPTGSSDFPFPSLEDFLERLFGSDNGAFAYLSGLLHGSDGLPRLQTITIDHTDSNPRSVLATDTFSVEAVGVEHGIVPTVGYLIQIANRRIAISGDQNLSTDDFTKLAHNADLLVMPMAIPEYDNPVALHARPSEIGAAAERANVNKLVLSHWMQRSLASQDQAIELVTERYSGTVQIGNDMQCIPLMK